VSQSTAASTVLDQLSLSLNESESQTPRTPRTAPHSCQRKLHYIEPFVIESPFAAKVQREHILEPRFEAIVVQLILQGKTEEALEQLARYYNVGIPKIKVGLPKGNRSKVLGCYASKNQTIYALNSDVLKDPFIILHEFYHHLRTSPDKRHKGTEKLASRFAKEFIETSRSPRTQYTYTVTIYSRKPGHNSESSP
jgi:hypothetical protein